MVTTLYRPVGLYELRAIMRVGWLAFPPRLPEQPIFYPVLNGEYATEIATQWNLDDPNSGFSGFVTRFAVAAAEAARHPRKVVGAARHEELWVPAAEQRALEAAMIGPIEVEEAWIGARFASVLPTWSGSVGRVEALDELLAQIARGPVIGGPATMG